MEFLYKIFLFSVFFNICKYTGSPRLSDLVPHLLGDANLVKPIPRSGITPKLVSIFGSSSRRLRAQRKQQPPGDTAYGNKELGCPSAVFLFQGDSREVSQTHTCASVHNHDITFRWSPLATNCRLTPEVATAIGPEDMQRRFIDLLFIIRRAALNQNHQLIFNDLVLAARLRTPRRCWSVHKLNVRQSTSRHMEIFVLEFAVH
ncbi:hypothetical protein JOM56_001017 [Amanita muscaria]